MSPEPEHDTVTRTFQEIYQRMVDRAPITEFEWPPVPELKRATAQPRRFEPGWKVAALAFLITAAFGVGWLAASGPTADVGDQFEVQAESTTESTAVPVPESDLPPSVSAADAAIAAALREEPDLENPHVTRIVGIYTDDTTVDLRVQVESDGFCHWYGVTGSVDQDVLEWRGGPAGSCEP